MVSALRPASYQTLFSEPQQRTGSSGGCPSKFAIDTVIAQFDMVIRDLAGWATPEDRSVLNDIDDWAVSDDIKRRVKATWPKIQGWWNTCLSVEQKQKVNRTMQWWRDESPGVLEKGIPKAVGDVVDSLGNVGEWVLRGGAIVAGIALVVVAVVLLYRTGGNK